MNSSSNTYTGLRKERREEEERREEKLAEQGK
jgi:hypothetical protein